jgi:hypothetical protein
MEYTDNAAALQQLAIIRDAGRSLVTLADANLASRMLDVDAVAGIEGLSTEVADAVTALAALVPVVEP